MDIITIKEASLIWGVSVRRITALCNEGRIAGARKIAGVWLLPENAEKPADARIKSGYTWVCFNSSINEIFLSFVIVSKFIRK